MGEKGEGSGGEGGGNWGGKGEGTGNGVPPCPPPQYYMVNTYDLSTIKMHLFISIVHFRSRESTLFSSNFLLTPV